MKAASNQHLAFLDIEASGLGQNSFPIEVGWAMLNGRSGSWLIKPAAGWSRDVWDEAAEDLHGISWQQLEDEGHEAWVVVEELSGILGPAEMLVLSDAPDVDSFWLDRLFEQSPITRRFQLTDFTLAFHQTFPAVDIETVALSLEAPRQHRAEADAKLPRGLWLPAAQPLSSPTGISHYHAQGATTMQEQTTNNIDRSARIRSLNDSFRTSGIGGMTVVTNGIAALPAALGQSIYRAVEGFSDFNADNDPWGEHDCASLNVEGTSIIWKIDYYDRSRRYLSPDAADPKLTLRVLTIMLAEEY